MSTPEFPEDDYWDDTPSDSTSTPSPATSDQPADSRLKVLAVSLVGFVVFMGLFALAILFFNWNSDPLPPTPEPSTQQQESDKGTLSNLAEKPSESQSAPLPQSSLDNNALNTPTPTPIIPTQVNVDPTQLTFGDLQTETFVVMDKRVFSTTEGTLFYTLYVSSQKVQNKPYVVLKSIYDSVNVTSTLQLSYRVDSDGRVSFVR